MVRPEGTSLVVQWLRLCTSNAGGRGLDPWLGNLDLTCCTVWAKKKKEHSQTSPSCGHMKMEQEMARLHGSKGKSSMFAVTHQPPSPSTFHSRTTADNRKIKFLAWKSCSLKADVQTGVLGGRSIPQFRGSSSQGAALLQALVFVCLF